MSKLSDQLRQSLAKKQGLHHTEGESGQPQANKRVKVKPLAPAGGRPQFRPSGRGG